MPLVEESILVRCPQGRAFRFTTDPVNAHRYDRNLIRYVPIDTGPRQVGFRFHTVTRVAGRRLESVMEIVEFDPPERFGLATYDSPLEVSISLRFSPVDDGISITWQVRFQGLGSFFHGLSDRVITEVHARDLRTNLKELKRILESDVD